MNESLATTVSQVSHSFVGPQGPLEVLRNVSIHVSEGEIVAILGPSGCGKSTLLNCIAGLIKFDRGVITVNGMTPSEALSAKIIGFAFQDAGLLPWRSVEDNILLPAELGATAFNSDGLAERVNSLLSKIGMTSFRGYFPDQLSGGMKQRVSLARALLLHPKLLLLDEPFGSLDLLTRTHLSVELSRIANEIKVPTIVVTHSIEEAVFLGTRVLVLSALPGRIVEEIEVRFPAPRDIALLEQTRFLEIVAHCRSLLFKGESSV